MPWQVKCPKLETIKLSCNTHITTLEPLDRAIMRDAVPNLSALVCAACSALRCLPTEIGRLSHLSTLVLADCGSLEDWPASMSELTSLRLLDLRACGLRRPPQSLTCSLPGLKVIGAGPGA